MVDKPITIESIRAGSIELEQSGVIPSDHKARVAEFRHFRDKVGKEAVAKGLTEEILNEILASDS